MAEEVVSCSFCGNDRTLNLIHYFYAQRPSSKLSFCLCYSCYKLISGKNISFPPYDFGNGWLKCQTCRKIIYRSTTNYGQFQHYNVETVELKINNPKTNAKVIRNWHLECFKNTYGDFWFNKIQKTRTDYIQQIIDMLKK